MEKRQTSATRVWGSVLVVTALACWLSIVVAVATANPTDGANIGAGMLFLLAVPCTVAGAVLLTVDWRTRPRASREVSRSGVASDAAHTYGMPSRKNPVASWALGAGIVGCTIFAVPLGFSDRTYLIGLGFAVVLCVTALLLGWLGMRQSRTQDGAGWGPALWATILGLIGLCLNVPLLLEQVFLLID